MPRSSLAAFVAFVFAALLAAIVLVALPSSARAASLAATSEPVRAVDDVPPPAPADAAPAPPVRETSSMPPRDGRSRYVYMAAILGILVGVGVGWRRRGRR